MKKLITFRAAITLLLFVAGITQVSAKWVGASAIYVNGTWYRGGEHDLNAWCEGGYFNNHDFGEISSISLGGQSQVYDGDNNDWGSGTMDMHYKIDNGSVQTITLTYYEFKNNNNKLQSGGSSFSYQYVDISGLSAGDHTISVWFESRDIYQQNPEYDSNNGINYVAHFTIPATQNVSAGTNGIATYSSAFNLDFSSPTSSISAYTVSSLTSTSASLTKVTQNVPAKTGLIIMGANNANEDISVVTTSTSVGTNYLKASVTKTAVGAGVAYVLYNGEFHPANAGDINANKAYLLASDIGSDARSLSLVFNDESTGISQVGKEPWMMGNYYDLSGRRVAQPTKGLYIVNGKKVIVK